MTFPLKQNKTLNPLHILLLGTNAIVLNTDTLADLIKAFWRCVFSLHKQVAINIVMTIKSRLTDYESGLMHLRSKFNIHLKRCLLIVMHKG
jgi:hypothetical protein